MKRTRRGCLALAPIVALALASLLGAPGPAAAQGTIKMTVGQAGINPGTSLFFIAEKEHLYAKHGLKVQIIRTTTSSAVQAMLGGSMQIATGSAGAAFVTATLEGAPPFVLVSSWINVFPYTIVAAKGIKTPAELKGKTGQVGATFGTAPDVALRFGLRKLGINPDKDVQLIQMPRPDWANVMIQLERGDVQFALLPPPYDHLGERRGFHPLISLPDLHIPWQQNGEWVQKSYLQSNREAVLRFLKVISDATNIYFNDKEKTLALLTEFLGTKNPADTEYAYERYKKWANRVPVPKPDTLATTLKAIERHTPKAAGANPASFINAGPIRQLIKEGYFKK